MMLKSVEELPEMQGKSWKINLDDQLFQKKTTCLTGRQVYQQRKARKNLHKTLWHYTKIFQKTNFKYLIRQSGGFRLMKICAKKVMKNFCRHLCQNCGSVLPSGEKIIMKARVKLQKLF